MPLRSCKTRQLSSARALVAPATSDANSAKMANARNTTRGPYDMELRHAMSDTGCPSAAGTARARSPYVTKDSRRFAQIVGRAGYAARAAVYFLIAAIALDAAR